jgi:DNA-binding NarL/FixJ family response regulator
LTEISLLKTMEADNHSKAYQLIKVAVLENNPNMLFALGMKLDKPDLNLCFASDTLEDFVNKVREFQPDVAIIDLRIWEDFDAGFVAIEEIRKITSSTACIVYTHYDSLYNFDQAVRLGAKAFVSKHIREKVPLDEVVRMVAKGGTYWDKDLWEKYIRTVARLNGKQDEKSSSETYVTRPRLSKRELDVLQLLDRGLTFDEVAAELVITRNTVDAHTKNIREKLNVNSTRQAVVTARLLGLLDDE